jgi:hypothetical protein
LADLCRQVPTCQSSPSIQIPALHNPSHKAEKILKGSLHSIPSPKPSVKVQIMGGKVCSKYKGKTLLRRCRQTFENKKFVDIIQQCFALLLQVNFPTNNLNFH